MKVRSNEYTLTGGYFLSQILECMNAQGKRRGSNNGGITQSNCFKNLILLGLTDGKIVGDEKTLREDTSKYKACKLEPSLWMRFSEDGYKKSFNNLIQNDYETLLQKTIEWGNKYLDLDINGDRLGKAIIEMLLDDDNIIPEETELYVCRDGKSIFLSELVHEDYIAIQPLILGVWNYIVNSDIPNDFREKSKNVKNGLSRREVENIGKNDVYVGRIKILKPTVRKKLENTSLTDVFTETIPKNSATMRGEKVDSLIKAKEKIASSDDEISNYLRKSIRQLYVSKSLSVAETRNFESNKDNSIRLNEMINPWNTIINNLGKVFELKTTFEFKSVFNEPGERSIEVSCEVHGIHMIGSTSKDNWKSESYMNNILRAGKYKCTAWFTVINMDATKCYIQFLIIGGEITW